ncbi:entericidin EcnA/B family protein [Celeribacter sp.]
MRRLICALSIAALTGLSACGTVAGMGEDIQNGARTVQGWL